MPGNSFIPNKDMELQAYAADFLAKIAASPATYGLLPADATAMAPYVTGYTANLNLATDPSTKTKVTTMQKNVSRVQIISVIRALARRVQANNTVTAAAKIALGLPVHSLVPSPIPAPVTRPMVNPMTFTPGGLKILIVDETTPTKRKRPAGAIGAQIFSFIAPVGTAPPADLKQWAFQGIATRADFQLHYAPADSGKEASIIARWLNGKGETGPNSIMTAVPIAA